MLDESNKVLASLRSSFTREDLEAIDGWANAVGTAGWYKFQAAAQIYAAEKIRRSNERIAAANEKYAKAMMWLTGGLVFVGILQILLTLIRK